jgi:hypothetical protein
LFCTRRSLAQWGFGGAHVRADQAWHLQQTGHPPSAIAASLGFADVASYRRSDRRWTGLAPG